MAEPYIGEIKLFSYTAIPSGWHLCDGAILPVAQNQALYSLIGNIYGGTAPTTFALPDLRGRTPVGGFGVQKAKPYGLGAAAGSATVALVAANLPAHGHYVQATRDNGNTGGANNVIYAEVALPSAANLYGPVSTPLVAIDPSTVQPAGAGAAHNNMQPYLAMVYCIATVGDYPPRPN